MKIWQLFLGVIFIGLLTTATVYGAVIYGGAWLYNDYKVEQCTTTTFNTCMSKDNAVETKCNDLAARQCK